jgi:hypothetical protein
MRMSVLALALMLPAAALAQPYSGDPMTHPVTPRDIPWYMAHPSALQQTLHVCHSNAAYAVTADCQNAEGAGAGQLRQWYHQAVTNLPPSLDPKNSIYWDSRPIARAGVLAQCRRHGPGDEMVLPDCAAAAASALRQTQAR